MKIGVPSLNCGSPSPAVVELMKSTASIPNTTRAKTVNPPFCSSRLARLSSTLINHWLVAELGLPDTFAIATVPRSLGRSGLNSLTIVPNVSTNPSGSLLS